MHQTSFNLTLEEISKIEGGAGLSIVVREGQVKDLKLRLGDYKRFYTQAVRGKPLLGVPQLVARICGTCSNAHLLCSIKAIEKGLGINPSKQTKLIRRLLYNGLIIRDHGLHLYVFVLPDIIGKDSILEFDEKEPTQHQLLHDTFTVKSVGNHLSVVFGGRSVHAPYPVVGGFTHFPKADDVNILKQELQDARPAALRLIKLFLESGFDYQDDTTFVALKGKSYEFLGGKIFTSNGDVIEEKKLREYLEHTVIPYSQASGYKFRGEVFMVGALARINLSRELLHSNTQRDASEALQCFPSKNVFHNNLAQAIEILHCIDDSLELLEKYREFPEEPVVSSELTEGIGIGVIEAPRGTLFHKHQIKDGKILQADIIVPTGQNQITMEKNLVNIIKTNLDKEKEQIAFEIEKFIRAYDPCISCATHFLKVRWL